MASEIVADPVGHISISGVHGRDELNERLEKSARAASRRNGGLSLTQMLAGAAVGAIVMYLVDEAFAGRRRRRRSM